MNLLQIKAHDIVGFVCPTAEKQLLSDVLPDSYNDKRITTL